MKPQYRLTRNLHVVLRLLADGPIENILQHGLAEEERRSLLLLELVKFPTELKEIAHGLLHITERKHLATTLRQTYVEERTRRWPATDA